MQYRFSRLLDVSSVGEIGVCVSWSVRCIRAPAYVPCCILAPIVSSLPWYNIVFDRPARCAMFCIFCFALLCFMFVVVAVCRFGSFLDGPILCGRIVLVFLNLSNGPLVFWRPPSLEGEEAWAGYFFWYGRAVRFGASTPWSYVLGFLSGEDFSKKM